VADTILSDREVRQYSRQIMLPEIGIGGQEKLKKASVLVVGAGGLGCPVLQYLAAAGIGHLAIAEFDTVSEANLQRQVLYGSEDIGKLKSIIATKRIEHLNTLVRTERINIRIDASNSLKIFGEYDMIVDTTDNLNTRYIISDTCVILGKPMIHGAIYKYEGQVSVFNYRGGPTYRCFNPAVAEGEYTNPEPSKVGLFGVLPGITGTIMANEVIKIITGLGSILSGRMLLFNILDYSFNIIEIPVIPENQRITKLYDHY